MLCHHAEVAKNFRYCTTDCLFYNVIGGEKCLSGKQSTLMKPEESAGCHQTLSRRWGLETRLDSTRTGNRRKPVVNYSSEDVCDSQSYIAGLYPGR